MKKVMTMKIKVNIMRKSLLLITGFFLVTSCTKEEFAPIKSPQNSTVNALTSTSILSCSQRTLVSPKVDVLLLWDNSTSSVFINPAVKASFSSLIDNISEKFDYHILSAPLIPINSTNPSLYEASLVTKDTSTLSGTASTIIKSKAQAEASLLFTPARGSSEPGVDRAYNIIKDNRTNGIFRNDAYTIIVLMSNGDDTSCEMTKGYNCTPTQWIDQMKIKIKDLLCLRGNTNATCSGGPTSLNSNMMRFINISALTSCSSGLYKVNSRYRYVSKSIYEEAYTNSWPTSNDNLKPFKSSDGTPYPDSYDICSIDFSHIFDGINTAIKQTLIKHVYEYWPVPLIGAPSNFDPNTLRVVRTDGITIPDHIGGEENGFSYIGEQNNHITRIFPTAGENYTGKMIQLFGTSKVVYPDCLTISYDALKLQFGYIKLQKGEPNVPSIVVTINGRAVPKSDTNGWSYIGIKSLSELDPNLAVVDNLGTSSSYFLQLNGSARFNNIRGENVNVNVAYTSKAN